MTDVLDERVCALEPHYRDFPVAAGAIVFGRGSEPDPEGGRMLTDAAKQRVLAIGGYLLSIESHLSDYPAPKVGEPTPRKFRVQFSCGWAAGNGETAPDIADREAELMLKFAGELGLLRYFDGLVQFDAQADSYSTISDAVFAARSNFLGHQPNRIYSPDKPLAVIAQEDHMGRCVDATSWAFGLGTDSLLEIFAAGEDQNFREEKIARNVARIVTIGARHSHNGLLRRGHIINIIGIGARRVTELFVRDGQADLLSAQSINSK